MSEVNSNNQFQITLPDDWIDRSIYIFDGPEVSGVQHSLTLVINRELPDDDLDQFAQERIDALVNSVPGMEILKNENKTLPNGTECRDVVIKWVPVDEKIIFQKKVYMILGGRGYTFSANMTKQTMKTIGLDIDRMINSFSSLEADTQ